MPDLRALTLDERRALALEAERRARAGEAPKDIRADMGVTKRAYSSWAKLFGFRQCDLFPDSPRSGAPVKHPPGPGGYVRSGRGLMGLPAPPEDGRRVYGPDHPSWTGGRAASRERYNQLRDGRKATADTEVEAMARTLDLHRAVKALLADGDHAGADRLLMAWRRQRGRARALRFMENLIREEGDGEALQQDVYDGEDEMSDEELCARLSKLIGRPFRVAPDPDGDEPKFVAVDAEAQRREDESPEDAGTEDGPNEEA